MQVDWDVNAVAVTTRSGIADLDGRMEKRTVTTGCGQGTVFGDADGRNRIDPAARGCAS